MKILCDSSYLLPLIKVSIEGIPPNLLLELLVESKHKYYYSEISLFKITAKGLKLIDKEETITLQDVMSGLDAIQNDSRLEILSWTNNPYVLELASKFRAIHRDVIDCLIFATAICYCDCVITMDHNFYNRINQNSSILSEILSLNKNFHFWFDDLSGDPILLSEEKKTNTIL